MMRIKNTNGWLLCVLAMSVFLAACAEQAELDDVTETAQEPPKPLSVIFVATPGVGTEVARQWAASRNGVLNVREVDLEELFADDYANLEKQDVIVYPPMLLGQLVADERILDLPDEVWDATILNNRGLLRNSRTTLIRFDKKRMAIPLGAPSLCLFCRTDVLQAIGVDVPETWEDLIQLKQTLADAEDLKDADGNALPTDILIPTDESFAGNMLLAMAAASIRHRGKLDTVFDRDTMKPLITAEPFVDALVKCQAIAGEFESRSVQQCVSQFCRGDAAVAVGWPAESFVQEVQLSDEAIDKCVITRLPGNTQWFDFSTQQWNRNEQVAKVELVGFDGMQASLLTTNSHPTTAFDFLAWLGSKQTAVNALSKSPHSAPTRASHLGNSLPWTGDMLSVENADAYAEQLEVVNNQQVSLMFPRLRETPAYITSLSKQVVLFLQGRQDANKALATVASEWESITARNDAAEQSRLLRMNIEL